MNRDINRPISRQALGRISFLGGLYDATTDEFCERSVLNDDIPAVAIRCLDENRGHSFWEFDTSQSKKLEKLNVDVSLSLSVLGGLIKSAGASAGYIYSKDKTSQTIEATFIHRAIKRTESLNVSHKEVKSRVEPTALRHRNATHVVTSIRWGADVFAHFEAKSTSAESKHTAKASLKLELNKLFNKFISLSPNSADEATKDAVKPTTTEVENGSTAPQLSLENTSTTTTFHCKITLFGDLIPTTCPKSIDELSAMLPSIITGLQHVNGGKGRPLEYTMLPLTELADILGQDLTVHRIFRAVEENIAHEIQTIFDEAGQLRIIAHTLKSSIQHVKDFVHDEEVNQIDVYQRAIIHMENDIRSRIGKMLVRVRSANAESSELDQLLVELESQIAAQKLQTKQLEHGDLNEKINFTLQLKGKNVLSIREPDTLLITQNKHPKHQLIVLYTSNELRLNSKNKWISTYLEFIRHIESDVSSGSRVLFCYFDFDLNPNFQPIHKKIEVKEYVGAPVSIPTARVRLETIGRHATTTGIDSLFRNVNTVATDYLVQWHRNAKIHLDEIFAKTHSYILLPYTPSSTTRSEVFDGLCRDQKNVLLIGRSCAGKSTLKNILIDPVRIHDVLKSYSQTEFPLFEQYSISGTDVILNFIDTPGLFQRSNPSSSSPDNKTLVQLINGYIHSRITQLHFICFCLSIDTNVNTDHDLQTVKTFFDFLGPEIGKNACLVITNCESKTEQERADLCTEVRNNLELKSLTSQMKQGIFFTGSLTTDDWIGASNTIYKQFENICQYRNKLIQFFASTQIKPFDLTSRLQM